MGLVRSFWGEELHVVLPELSACELDRYGLIEPGVTRLFLDLVEPGMVVFDVGAHLGYFSLLARRLGATVRSFEPSAVAISLLRRNVGGSAQVIPKGLWSESGSLLLKDFGAKHSAVNTFLEPKDASLRNPERVQPAGVLSLDDYVSASGLVPDLIKLDVEGAEAEVLIGGRATIRNGRPIITMEVGDAAGTPRSREALEVALSLGYDIYDLTAEGPTPHVLQEQYAYGNVALVPRSA